MGENGSDKKKKYSHQEFKIKAADEKGHVERIQLRIPPPMFSKMQKVVNSKLWPFENYQEFCRHAILRELNFLEQDRPEIGNLTARIQSMHAMMHEETEQQTMQDTYEKMQAVFRKNLAIGGQEARSRNLKLMSDIWKQICAIDEPFWRELWKKKFRGEYDKVLEAAPKASLAVLGDDDEECEE